jgi:DNA-binding CsgD family transcriptional regulator
MGAERADTTQGAPNPPRVPLTRREREILGLLAEGMSGVQIATKLVLSPETVRTHVRNAMAKLGASTRSQAVALALQQQEISREAAPAAAPAEARPARAATPAAPPTEGLERMLAGLVSLYDVERGAVYLTDEDGLSLNRVATAGSSSEADELPGDVALGEGALGRAALDRRTQLVQDPGGGVASGGLIAAPVMGGGRLLGVIALAARGSRPVGRNEMLLLQAFAGRVGDVLAAGDDMERRLERAMERFRTSWSAARVG